MPQIQPPHPDSETPPSEEAIPSPPQTPAVQPKKSNRSKQSAVTFLTIIGILAVILLLLNLIPFEALSEKTAEQTEAPAVTVNPLFFDTPVYDEDFTQDSAYMDLERRLRFTILSGETFLIDGDAAEYGDVCQLFEDFRVAVIEGDCDAYNALFTDEYIEKKGRAEFAPQKLYRFNVAVISSELLADGDANGLYQGATVTHCTVEYCIKDNNGTFRADFYRDGDSKTQIFQILEYNDSVKISQISTPTHNTPTATEKEGLPIMFYIWIAMIVLAIVAEAITTSLVAIWFVPGAIISMILALAGADIYAQVITYVVSALVLLILFKLLSKKFRKKKGYTPTNADRIIGAKGIVTEEINNIASSGEVKIDGKRWTARTEKEGEIIAEGSTVTILRIEGVKLICAPEKDESAE